MTSLLPASTASRVGVAGLLLAAAGFGVVAGRTHAWNQSVGGLTAALGGGVVLFGVIFGVVIIAVVAVVLARIVTRGPVPGLRVAGLTAAAVALGFAGGLSTAAATGGTYREPVVLESSGTVRLAVTTPGIEFVPTAGASASCHSLPDGTTIEGLSTLDLGELTVAGASGSLRADIRLTTEAAGAGSVSLWIDGGDLPEGSFQPFWDGRSEVSQPIGARGTITFTSRLASDKVDPSLTVAPWPESLSGSIEWSCSAW